MKPDAERLANYLRHHNIEATPVAIADTSHAAATLARGSRSGWRLTFLSWVHTGAVARIV